VRHKVFEDRVREKGLNPLNKRSRKKPYGIERRLRENNPRKDKTVRTEPDASSALLPCRPILKSIMVKTVLLERPPRYQLWLLLNPARSNERRIDTYTGVRRDGSARPDLIYIRKQCR